MRRKTSTKQLTTALSNNLLKVQKVEIYNKTTRENEPVNSEKFIDCLKNISKYEILADALGWTYEWDYKSGHYLSECGRMDGNSENIVSVYLCVNDGVSREEIDRMLKIEEE